LNRLKGTYPNADVVQANLTDINDIRRIMRDVTVVYHVGPTYHPHETQIGYSMIDAAIHESTEISKNGSGDNAGGTFKHFFLSSVLNS